ncbi:MAG: mycothiol system anti-sigma-R factor [Candidatus Scalinduaceae bacterium]
MNCKEATKQLYEYLDNELEENDYSKIKKHLEVCRKCCEKFEFEQVLKKVVRDRARIHRVPQNVRENIVKQLSERHEGGGRVEVFVSKLEERSKKGFFQLFKLRSAYIIEAALILLLISVLSIYFTFPKPGSSPHIVKDAAERHDNFVNGNMPLDLVTSDRNEIKRYLNDPKQVYFADSVPVFNEFAMKPLGCKKYYLAGRKSAYIGLERMHNKISLEVMDSSGMNINDLKNELFDGRQYYFGRYKGYNVVLWKYGNKLYSLTSKIHRKELMRMAEKAICPYYER